ncbi:hypothetical protein HWV62_21084 [Athelia sp. TMB]|nr:hypothetical protein HWV62_21084 [Athelia sp. TMB]
MARTKATAAKATGGNAPRRALASLAGSRDQGKLSLVNGGQAVIPATPPLQAKSQDMHEMYCPVCCDGSESLVLCDHCPRVICKTHLGDLPDGFDISQHDFLCMACHEYLFRKTPYRAFYKRHSVAKETWIPSLARPISLRAEYTLARNSHVSNSSTLILHFHLPGLARPSLPSRLIEFVLREYLDPCSLRIIEVPYDFSDGFDSHAARAEECVAAIASSERTLSFITTHAHVTTGDLYGGPDFSADPYEVLKALFPPVLRKAFRGKRVYLFFLVCGGFTDSAISRLAMFKAARK